LSNETVYLLLPEVILALSATLMYLGGAFLPARAGWGWLAAATLVVAGLALASQSPADSAAASGEVVRAISADGFAYTMRWAMLGVALVFVLLAARTSEWGESSEFMASLLLLVDGLMLISLAGDLVLMFAGLELVSIPTYVLLFLARTRGALESGTKYFFLSVLSSALLLYGFSFLYGAAGSVRFEEIRSALAAGGADLVGTAAFAPLALVLIFAGLGFRLTAVPFHFYAPDVYQGTNNPNAGLLAVAPKIAALVALVRIALVAMPGTERLGWQLALALAMITMTLGNVLALWQNNIRRMMAYSSVAHAGYMLIGLAVGFAVAGGAAEATNFDGIGAALFYMLVYAAATAGVFAALTYLGGREGEIDTVDQLAGLVRNHPKTALAMAIFMFSLTGLPPLAGFWGKFTLFTGALGVDARNPGDSSLWPWFFALAIVGALNAAISAGYYLRIVGVMYFRSSSFTPPGQGGAGAALAVALCVLLVVGIGCAPGWFVEESIQASQAAQASLGGPRIVPDTTAAKSPPEQSPSAVAVKLLPADR
jgi:NADH-quinone oxidoreductase subunit N